MTTSAPALTISEAADELGVAPARIRALIASGSLSAVPGEPGLVSATETAELVRRGVLRSVDVAAVEGAVDRALRRRLPGLLDLALTTALRPVADELALAVADIDISTRQAAEAQARATAAEQSLGAARARVAALEARLAALQARPVGLFRRRREVAPATA